MDVTLELLLTLARRDKEEDDEQDHRSGRHVTPYEESSAALAFCDCGTVSYQCVWLGQ